MGVYESEARLEDRMIEQLVKQGYEKVQINDVKDLENNFREQVNKHNKTELKNKPLSDKEFEKNPKFRLDPPIPRRVLLT